MGDVLGFAGGLTVSESALYALSAVILALFAVTIAFSGYAVLLRARHDRKEALWEKLSAKWQEPVLAVIMDPAQIPAAQALVADEHRLHFVRFVLEYSRRVKGEERETLRQLAHPFLEGVVAQTGDRRSEIRTRAIQTLGTLGLPAYGDYVVAGLSDPSPLVSMVAARYLARKEFPQYAIHVLDHLDRFEGWNRRFFASMLAAMGPEVAPRLRDGLGDPETAKWLRGVYAEALWMQGDPLSGDIAAKALETANDRESLAALLRLIASVGYGSHVEAVRPHCTAADVVVRAQALHALGRLGDESEIPFLREAMLDDDSPWTALHAARGVKEAGGSDVLKEIAESDHPHARLAGQVLYEEDDS